MAQRVKDRNEISLNGAGNRYRLSGGGRVRQTLQSQYPQKRVFGDVDKDSNPRTSLVVWDDWTGGIGLYSTNGKEGMSRSLFNRCETRFKGHLTLPKVMTSATDNSVSGSILEISERAGVIIAAMNGGTDAYIYTPASGVGGGSWGSKVHDFPAVVTDSLNFTLAGTEYVAFACTSDYTFFNGSSWANSTSTKPTVRLAFWDDRLWGIDNTGQLWFSTAIDSETNDAKLSLPAGYVNELFTGPDAAGEDILYVSTNVGLYAHDAANARFVKTKVAFPQDGTAKHGAATWNGEIYVAVGDMAVWRYDPVGGTITSVGLDRDAGLDSGAGGDAGDIVRLVPVHSGVIAQVNGATNDSIWEYNGIGWHFIGIKSGSVGTVHASDAGGYYRLYWSITSSATLQFRVLDTGHVNPDVYAANITYDQASDTRYFLVTPWFNAGQNEIDKTAIRIRLDCTKITDDEIIKVEYALNYANVAYESASTPDGKSEFSIIGTASNGVTSAEFPKIGTTATPPVANTTSQPGVDFRAIRFKITLNGDTATSSPNLKSLSLEWRRKLKARYGFTFDIDRTSRYAGRSPKEQKAALVTAFEQGTMVELTYVDDTGNSQNYYVDITSMEDVQETGHGEAGVTRITAVES